MHKLPKITWTAFFRSVSLHCNFSSQHLSSCVSYFSQPISIKLWIWWQTTGIDCGAKVTGRGDYFTFGALCCVSSIWTYAHTQPLIQRQRCDVCVTDSRGRVIIWPLAEDEGGSNALCPFNLYEWIPHLPLLTSGLETAEKDSFHSLTFFGFSFSFLFLAVCLLSCKLSLSCLPSSLVSSVSYAASFFSVCRLSFASLSLKLHLRGNLLSSLEHTCFPIKSRCICLSKVSLSSLFLPSG